MAEMPTGEPKRMPSGGAGAAGGVSAAVVPGGPAEARPDAAATGLVDREERALGIVRGYVYSALAVGLIPAPVVDVTGLLALQLKMVHSLCEHYGVPFREDLGKSTIGALLGAVGPVALARGTFGSLVKAIPVVGTAVGIATQPVLAGGFTYATGKVFIQHFECGGTFLDMNPRALRAHFAKEFQQGRALAAGLASAGNGKAGPGQVCPPA